MYFFEAGFFLAINTILAIIGSDGQPPDQCRAMVCNGAGWCQNNGTSCLCDTGQWNTTDDGRMLWISYEYDTTTNCSSCLWNYYGVNCTVWGLKCRQDRCNGNGTCTGRWSGCACDHFQDPMTNCTQCLGNWWLNTSCSTCQPGWFGLNCEQTPANCSLTRCNGHGQCTGQTSGCECDTGWTGKDCSIAIPPPEGLSTISILGIVGGIIGGGVLVMFSAYGYDQWQARKKGKMKKIK